MYEAGTEGPLWWAAWPDPVRGLPAAGILDRCTATKTCCPKIMEHFGSAEVWDLNLSPSFVGTSADTDIPLPANVRRCYIRAQRTAAGAEGSASNRRLSQPARAGTSAWGKLPGQPGSAHPNRQRAPRAFPHVGDEGRPASGQRVADIGRRSARRPDEAGHRIPDDSGLARQRTDRLDEPRARLRLGIGFQLRRRGRGCRRKCRRS